MNYGHICSSLLATYPKYLPARTEPRQSELEENKQFIDRTVEDQKEEENVSNIDHHVPNNFEEIEVDRTELLWNSIESKLSIFKSKSCEQLSRTPLSSEAVNENSIIFTVLKKLEILLEKLGNNDFNDFLLYQPSKSLHVFNERGKNFEGFFDQNLENGFAVVRTKKFKYIGTIVKKNYEGPGVMIHEGKGFYIGNWKNGKREGYGRYSWPDGAEYQGYFVEGNMQGIGTFMYTNKDIFKGEFRDNTRNGKGRYFYKSSNYLDFDEGEWQYGEMTVTAVIVRNGNEREVIL